MRLQYNQIPRAGETFILSITGSVGIARVTWMINDAVLNVTKCEDPPCYEEMYIEPRFAGRELRLIGEDEVETKELRLRIGGTDTAPITAALA